jgi:hypothetical protein
VLLSINTTLVFLPHIPKDSMPSFRTSDGISNTVTLLIIANEKQNEKPVFILSERRDFKRFTLRDIVYTSSPIRTDRGRCG